MALARDILAFLHEVPGMELHLVVSAGARRVMHTEGLSPAAVTPYAARVYAPTDMAAPPSSGSWQHDGMVVCPCSMSSLAAIATGAGRNLIHRAADVSLKERRPLILVARETPLSLIHLKNMQAVTEAGASVMPFMPAYYSGRTDWQGLVCHFTGRVLDQLHIAHSLCTRWGEAYPRVDRGGAPQRRFC